jgi:ABC-type glutathione transport system ATPase component
VLAVGDADFQAKCGDKLAEYRDRGKTIVLVTHSMGDVVRLCRRAAWIDHGQLKMIGAPGEITDAYLDAAHEGRSVQVNDTMRWGTGELQVTAVDLLDGSEKPITIPRSGDPLAIRFVLSAERPVIDPELVVTIHDQSGTLVTEVGTRSRNVRIDQVHGERTVTLELDRLALTEGTYELTAAVRDESGQRDYDVRNRFVRFDVMKGTQGDGGVVSLGGEWSID